jgi:hypothetical protein
VPILFQSSKVLIPRDFSKYFTYFNLLSASTKMNKEVFEFTLKNSFPILGSVSAELERLPIVFRIHFSKNLR